MTTADKTISVSYLTVADNKELCELVDQQINLVICYGSQDQDKETDVVVQELVVLMAKLNPEFANDTRKNLVEEGVLDSEWMWSLIGQGIYVDN